MRSLRVLVSCGPAWLAACVAPEPPAPRPAGDERPATETIGFRSSWELDGSRTYRTAFDEGDTYGAKDAPRPVLMNLWYPARAGAAAEPMPHGGYLELPSSDPRFARLAAELAEYERGVLATELLGRAEEELSAEDQGRLEEVLQAPTGCVRDAAPAEGPFPLVVYHAGAGSSFEDDAYLCEELARHGYVVAGSSYLRADGSSFGIDGRAGSARDMTFLVARARELPFVDWTRVALVGHSAGAQAILRCAGEPDCPADALVLLDTTQDYYVLDYPMHAALVTAVTAGIEHLDQRLLVAAGPEACFQLCDRLVHADRTYLTVPDLDHNEYIEQGHLHNALDLARGRTVTPADAKRIPAARARYETLCADVRLFLDAALRGDEAAFAARMDELARHPLGGPEPCVERVPRGTDGPPPYDPASDEPPTPRQLGPLIQSAGAESTAAILARFQEREPRSPIYDSSMLTGSLLFTLVEGGQESDARALHAYLRTIRPEVLGLFTFAIDVSRAVGRVEDARRFARAGLTLEPENAELQSRARELELQPGS